MCKAVLPLQSRRAVQCGMAAKVFGFTAVYALVDVSLELSGERKLPGHHLLAATTAAAWVHAATKRTTQGISRSILVGGGLGLVSAPLDWVLFNSGWIEPKPKSILTILREVRQLVDKKKPEDDGGGSASSS